ncbi:MAG: hypothetical protein RKE49_08400 [Oceanicaulis sp.]
MDDHIQSRRAMPQSNRDLFEGAELMDRAEQKAHKISDRLTHATQRASAAFVFYMSFKNTRGSRFGEATGAQPIQRAPTYPDSHIMTFSILAGLILFEGLANAYFFSKGSDLGLLGGWIQAITVASANVIASFFVIGFLGLRMLQNPHRPFSFAAALIFVPLAAAFIVFLNFCAAHYRDLLEINAAMLAQGGTEQTGEMLAPVTRALTFAPFETLEALLLFGLGVTFAIIAAFKGATFDDRLIGYGAAHRRLVNASSHLAAVLKQLPAQAGAADGEAVASPTKRRRAVELMEQIDDMFAQEVEDALARHERRREEMDAGDTKIYSSEPPPRA